MPRITPLLTNLAEEHNSDSVYTDAAMTAPASTTGDVIKGGADQSGNGNHAVNASGSQTFKTNAINGHPSVVSNRQRGLICATGSTDTQAYTLYLVLKANARGNSTAQVYSASADLSVNFAKQSLGEPAIFVSADKLQSPKRVSIQEDWFLLKIVSTASGVKYFVDGLEGDATAVSSSIAIGFTIFDENFSLPTYQFSGEWTYRARYNADHSAVSTVDDALKLYYQLPRPIASNASVLSIRGHSLAYGYTATSNATEWFNVANTSLSNRWTIRSEAVEASLVADMSARLTWTAPWYASTRTNVSIVWIESNDLAVGTAPATVYASIKTACAAIKAQNPKEIIILANCLARPDLDEGVRATYNALIGADFTGVTGNASVFTAKAGVTFGDYLMDFGNHAQLGQSPQDPALSNDGFHTNDDGQVIEGGILTYALSLVPPAAPTSLIATPGTSQISLGWTIATGGTSQKVYRGTSSGTETALHTIADGTTSMYLDTSLPAGTTYWYEITALNASGESAFSNEASAAASAAGAGGMMQMQIGLGIAVGIGL